MGTLYTLEDSTMIQRLYTTLAKRSGVELYLTDKQEELLSAVGAHIADGPRNDYFITTDNNVHGRAVARETCLKLLELDVPATRIAVISGDNLEKEVVDLGVHVFEKTGFPKPLLEILHDLP